MKVFAYAGSVRNHKSQSLLAVQKVIERLEERNQIESCFIATPKTHPICSCEGCMKCYENGSCVFDKTDSMIEIREAALAADLIIIASPVYVHNVSGYTKNLIDRLCLWCYTMPLMGKLALTVSVSSTNGNSYVDSYLKKIVTIFGAGVLEQLSLYTALMTEEQISKKIADACRKIEKYVLGKEQFQVSKLQSEYYINSKNIFGQLDAACYIKEFWEENGMFDYEDAQSLFDQKASWREGYVKNENFKSKESKQGI